MAPISRRRRLIAICVAGFAVCFAMVGPALAANHKVRFWEDGDNTMYGVHGQWDDPLISQAIDCPSSGVNWLQSFVRVEFPGGSDFIETGVSHEKGTSCSAIEYYYQAYDLGSGPQLFTDPNYSVSDTSHEYSVNQLMGDWYSKVDGGSSFSRNCCNFVQIDDANEVRVGMECKQDTAGDCLSVGKVNPANNLTYKPSPSYSGTWPGWTNTGGECADYGHQARGKWNSATSVQFSFNVSIIGSISNAC